MEMLCFLPLFRSGEGGRVAQAQERSAMGTRPGGYGWPSVGYQVLGDLGEEVTSQRGSWMHILGLLHRGQ